MSKRREYRTTMIGRRLPSFVERAGSNWSPNEEEERGESTSCSFTSLDVTSSRGRRRRSEEEKKTGGSEEDLRVEKNDRGGDKKALEKKPSKMLESLTEELIASLRPSKQSEKRRRMVFKKMESLVRECFETTTTSSTSSSKMKVKPPIVVSAFGSVPFGTYLPDGDIDMCILGDHEVLDSQTWPERLSAFIAKKEREEKKKKETKKKKNETTTTTAKENKNEIEKENDVERRDEEYPDLEVKDVVVIHADVRLLKCVVDGIVVDVSANQFGGLSTLAFLNEVNAKIGKNDLFKRSVILVKAWAFYESRILGAPYALLSTYALKTLIICALRRFQTREIETPLDVLRVFFEYVSNFPWETHAATIFGDVPVEKLDKMSLKEFCEKEKGEYEVPDPRLSSSSLNDNFMDTILKLYGPDSRPDANVLLNIGNVKKVPFRRRAIGAKHLHILDPLSETNNLGRSVSLGNFARVRAAFRLGAERLKRLEMEAEPENIRRGFEYFFKVALANRGGKLASCVGDEEEDDKNDEKFKNVRLPVTPQTTNKTLHNRKPSLGSSSPFHSHSVADDLVALKSPCKPNESKISKDKISKEEDDEEKIRLMLDEEEKDAHGERGLFWGRWDGPSKPSTLPRALSSAEARAEIATAHDRTAKMSSSDGSISPPDSDASSPAVSPPRSETGDSTTDSAEYSGDDAKSVMSLGSDSNTTTSSNGSMPPNSPLSPLDKYMSSAAFKTASIPPPIEESKDIITGCLETIHTHLNFGIEMQRLAIERQNAALNNAMMMHKRHSGNVVAPPPPPLPPLPSSPPRSSTPTFVPSVPSMPSMPPPPLPPPLPPQLAPHPVAAVSAPSAVAPRSVVHIPAPQATRAKTPSMNVRPKPNPIPQINTTKTKIVPAARVPSMNWKIACGNSNSSSDANTPARNTTATTTNAEPAGSNVVAAKAVSAKLLEHQSSKVSEQDEPSRSSSETTAVIDGGNASSSMVETVAWVHVARGGAARQTHSSNDNEDALQKPSTPTSEEKKSKKTGKSWGTKKTKKARAEEAFVNDDLVHEREEIEREVSKGSSPARCKSVPLQPSWGPKGAVCLDTLRKVAEKKTTTSKQQKISPPGSVLSEDGGATTAVTFDESDVQLAVEAVRLSLKGVWVSDEERASSQKSKSANSSPRRKRERKRDAVAPPPESSCEKSFPKFGNTTTNATTKTTTTNNNGSTDSTDAQTQPPPATTTATATRWASIL